MTFKQSQSFIRAVIFFNNLVGTQMGKADVKTVAMVAVGVFVAGLIMNAFRKNDFVNNAINGFDA